MKNLLITATSLLVVLPATLANACKCFPTTPQQSFKSSQVVFAGRALDIIEANRVSGTRLVTFEVSKVWKGTNKQRIVVRTSNSSASCGYEFQEGKEYLVYASRQEAEVTTGSCSGTKPLSMARADLAVLGEGKALNIGSTTEKLQKNQQLWSKRNLTRYRYTLRVGCNCLPAVTQPVAIEVRDNQTTSIRSASGGNSVNPDYFKDYNTIDRLFEIVRSAIAKNPDRLEVKYHPTLGYPTQISIDYSQELADEELFVNIDRFEVIRR